MNLIKLIINILLEIIWYKLGYSFYENMVINTLKHISDYNIIFVKIFQWVWINNEPDSNKYITQKIEDAIYSYTNNTPYNETDINYKNLLDVYISANKNGDKFELVSTTPINSGSISLIFKAKLNNKDIVVKMLRTNIKERLEKGLGLLINLENFLHKLSYWLGINLVSTKMFEKNKFNIMNQVNFINETENLLIFYKNFKNTKYAETPFVYSNYTISNPNVILMDEIKGKYLCEINNDDLNKYLMGFFKFVMDSIFIKNIFHCDLHQGNVLFYNEEYNGKTLYKVGIIDMGMITKMNVDEVNFMYMWLSGLFNDKFADFIDYIKKEYKKDNFFEDNNINPQCFDDIQQLYMSGKIFNEFESEKIVRDIHSFLNIFLKYNCRISSRYNFFLLSMIPILGIISKLSPEFKKNKNIKTYLNKMSNSDLYD